MQKLETSEEKVRFTRVDADHIDNLIKKDDTAISKLSDEEKEKLQPMIEANIPKETYTVQLEAMDSNASPFLITVPGIYETYERDERNRWRYDGYGKLARDV